MSIFFKSERYKLFLLNSKPFIYKGFSPQTFLTDQNFSVAILKPVRMLLDNQGNVVNEITYDSFGNVTTQTNAGTSFRFSYTGRELDSETGQYYYRARYYDSSVGRFISEDPIGFEAGDSNVYRYVGNNPLFYVDPSGFCGVASFENDNDLDIGLNEPVKENLPMN
jgi:RHS repeat-associated protein